MRKIKWIDALRNVAQTEQNESHLDFEQIATLLDCRSYVHDDTSEQIAERLKAYELLNKDGWESPNNLSGLFFDGELVGVHSCRHDDDDYDFISKEAAMRVRDFIMSFEPKLNITMVDNRVMDSEICPVYGMDESSYCQEKYVIYNNELCDWRFVAEDRENVIVKYNGKEVLVKFNEVAVPMTLKPEFYNFKEELREFPELKVATQP